MAKLITHEVEFFVEDPSDDVVAFGEKVDAVFDSLSGVEGIEGLVVSTQGNTNCSIYCATIFDDKNKVKALVEEHLHKVGIIPSVLTEAIILDDEEEKNTEL